MSFLRRWIYLLNKISFHVIVTIWWTILGLGGATRKSDLRSWENPSVSQDQGKVRLQLSFYARSPPNSSYYDGSLYVSLWLSVKRKVFVIGTVSGDFMLPPSGARSQNQSVDNKGRDLGSFVLFKSRHHATFVHIKSLSKFNFGICATWLHLKRAFLITNGNYKVKEELSILLSLVQVQEGGPSGTRYSVRFLVHVNSKLSFKKSTLFSFHDTSAGLVGRSLTAGHMQKSNAVDPAKNVQ